jgi:hypothetical protein
MKIEKGIPMPGRNKPRNTKYPWEQMEEVGDSFLVPSDAGVATFRATAHNYGLRHNKKFTIRAVGGGRYRCWRTE